MDRAAWLADRRRAVARTYDEEGPTCDDGCDPATAVHLGMVEHAMENVPSEEWPVVLAAFHRSVRHGGHVYLTVEQIDRAEIDQAYERSVDLGLPVRWGEVVEGDVAGYHRHPERDQVERWLSDAGFTTIADVDEWLDGYGYRHLLVSSDAS